jgi:hypothetical protein
LLRKSPLELFEPKLEVFDGNAPAWFEKLLDGRGAVSLSRWVELPAPKPADGDGGMLAYGSVFRGADCVADRFVEKFDEGCEADRGRDELGSVACDWLLGTIPVFRGASVVEFDGNCEDGNCEEEGCRSSFDVEVGCGGRGADWFDDGSEVLTEGVVVLR